MGGYLKASIHSVNSSIYQTIQIIGRIYLVGTFLDLCSLHGIQYIPCLLRLFSCHTPLSE